MTKSNIQFSIVIPTYNSSESLVKAVESALAQDLQSFEIIVVDDGSTDATEELIANIDESLGLRYVKLTNSGGPARPRNIGIQHSKGDWICFLDADDTWLPTKLIRLASYIKNFPDIDVFCHAEAHKCQGTLRSRDVYYGPVTRNFYHTLLTCGNRLSTSAVAVKRSIIVDRGLKFNERTDYAIVEDYDFWLQLARIDAKFYFINEILGVYNLNERGISRDIATAYKNESTVIINHIKETNFDLRRQNLLIKSINLRREIEALFTNGFSPIFSRRNLSIVTRLIHNPLSMYYFLRSGFGRIGNKIRIRIVAR